MKYLYLLTLSLVYLTSSYTFSSEKSVYDFEWLDDDKEIYVLQNRKYRKDGKFNLSLFGTMNTSDKFVDTYGGGIKAAYFFAEEWGIELAIGLGSSSENTINEGIKEQGAVPFSRSITGYTAASMVWAPFYGKFNTFNLIYYLDWFLSLGLASAQTEDNRCSFSNVCAIGNDSLTTESVMAITWSTGFYWYLSKMWSVRFEFMGFHYSADRFRDQTGTNAYGESTTFHNYNINVGLNMMF